MLCAPTGFSRTHVGALSFKQISADLSVYTLKTRQCVEHQPRFPTKWLIGGLVFSLVAADCMFVSIKGCRCS